MNEKFKILLVEDNHGDAFLIKFYLEEAPSVQYELIHAEMLASALDLIAKNHFDVILLDLQLPDSSGIETLKKILDVAQNSIVIVLTGFDEEEFGVETVKIGAHDFLSKNQLDSKTLNSAIRFAFERHRLQSKVLKWSSELKNLNRQFDMVQKLTGTCFWEINLQTNEFVWSGCSAGFVSENLNRLQLPKDYSSFLKLVHPEDLSAVKSFFDKALRQEEISSLSFRLLNQETGETFALECSACRSQQAETGIHFFSGILRFS